MSEKDRAAAPEAGGSKKAAGKRFGLQLDLGGAPKVAHQLPGVPGLYHPDRPTLVGARGELSVGRARELAGDPGVPLKLVQVCAAAVPDLESAPAADLDAARGGIAQAARHADGAESAQVADEVTAIRSASAGEE